MGRPTNNRDAPAGKWLLGEFGCAFIPDGMTLAEAIEQLRAGEKADEDDRQQGAAAPLESLPGEYLQTAKAAHFLGLKPQTLRKFRWAGGGPRYTRIGGPNGRCVYAITELRLWAAERTFRSTADEAVARSR